MKTIRLCHSYFSVNLPLKVIIHILKDCVIHYVQIYTNIFLLHTAFCVYLAQQRSNSQKCLTCYRDATPNKQECIPVGCIPSTEVAIGGVSAQGVCLPGVFLPREWVSAQGSVPGGLPQCMLGYTPHLVDRILDTHL